MATNSSAFHGKWHIYEMEMWDEGYFNMALQAYIEIKVNNLGYFQFGLVEGQIDGKVVAHPDGARFEFSWNGYDENDPANGCGWLKFKNPDAVEGEIRLHLGDDSTFLARRAKSI